METKRSYRMENHMGQILCHLIVHTIHSFIEANSGRACQSLIYIEILFIIKSKNTRKLAVLRFYLYKFFLTFTSNGFLKLHWVSPMFFLLSMLLWTLQNMMLQKHRSFKRGLLVKLKKR